jgi:hypothetical protein
MKKLFASLLVLVFLLGAGLIFFIPTSQAANEFPTPQTPTATNPAATPAAAPANTQASGTSQVGTAPAWSGIVPCGRNSGANGETTKCTLCHLVLGFQRLVRYGLYMVIAVAFVAIFFAGVMYIVSSGDEGMMTSAKGFLRSALIGFFVVLGAWLIVNTTLWVLGAKTDLGAGQKNWYEISCSTVSTSPGGTTPASTTPNGAAPNSTTTNTLCPSPATCQPGQGKCPDGYSSANGECNNGSGMFCCLKDAAAGEKCGENNLGTCKSRSILTCGFVSGGRGCPSGYWCCNN